MVLTTGQSAELCNRTRRIYNLDLQPMQSKKALPYCHIERQVLQALESTDTQMSSYYFVHNVSPLMNVKMSGLNAKVLRELEGVPLWLPSRPSLPSESLDKMRS